MRINQSSLKNFFATFFIIFGIIEFMFIIRNFMPPYSWGGDIIFRNSIISFTSALIFSITHMILRSESLDNKITIKSRLLFCSIPCAGVSGFLAMNFGLQSWLRLSTDKTTAIVVWVVSFLISIIVIMYVYYLIEKHYIEEGKKYNEALLSYKEKYNNI